MGRARKKPQPGPWSHVPLIRRIARALQLLSCCLWFTTLRVLVTATHEAVYSDGSKPILESTTHGCAHGRAHHPLPLSLFYLSVCLGQCETFSPTGLWGDENEAMPCRRARKGNTALRWVEARGCEREEATVCFSLSSGFSQR